MRMMDWIPDGTSSEQANPRTTEVFTSRLVITRLSWNPRGPKRRALQALRSKPVSNSSWLSRGEIRRQRDELQEPWQLLRTIGKHPWPAANTEERRLGKECVGTG